MSMFCAEFERRLQRRLDRREPPQSDRRLVRHANCCPACRQMLAMQTLIAEQLTSISRPVPPASLTPRILARFEPCEPARSRPFARDFVAQPRGWRLAGGLALAATLLLGAWSLAMRSPVGLPGTAGPPSAQSDRSNQVSPHQPDSFAAVEFQPQVEPGLLPPTETALLPPADTAARQRFELLAEETGQGLAAVVLRLPGVGAESNGTAATSETDDTPWVEDVTSRLKPIAASLSDALGPWLESVASDERSRRS